ncbi:hypothetical protein [Paraburkholderia adhaesiva]|uniref:hypothetical protein n=1 Tax=Paraburkholderia adhaesiva TaxID=2883244 RepID=UPI001F1D0024|nr:hypothetical protein [Paraburkholderia adhaesiva]
MDSLSEYGAMNGQRLSAACVSTVTGSPESWNRAQVRVNHRARLHRAAGHDIEEFDRALAGTFAVEGNRVFEMAMRPCGVKGGMTSSGRNFVRNGRFVLHHRCASFSGCASKPHLGGGENRRSRPTRSRGVSRLVSASIRPALSRYSSRRMAASRPVRSQA